MSDTSESCYALLGLSPTATSAEVDRAWERRRQEVVAQSDTLSPGESEALLARLDEARKIVSDPQRSLLYGSYLKQTNSSSDVSGPEVFGALYDSSSESSPSAAGGKGEALAMSLGGPALQTLAEVVIAAPAPSARVSSPSQPTTDGSIREAAEVGPPSIKTGEVPPWMGRPTPTGDVPVSPPFAPEAREENFLSNLEVQERLQALHGHLAAADLIRKERNELLRQLVKTRAELEMRAGAEADLRKSLDENDQKIERLRHELDHFRMVAEEAEADLRDLEALKTRITEELLGARDAKEAAELTAKGARADLETVRVRVAQLEDRIGGQEALLTGERKVTDALRGELEAAEKRRDEADAVAAQARDAYRSVDSQLAARDGEIAELEGRLEEVSLRLENDAAARGEAESRYDEAMARADGLIEESQTLRVALDDARSELADASSRIEELDKERRLQLKRYTELDAAKSSVEVELETTQSTLSDTRRALELGHQEAERYSERGQSLEAELRERDRRHETQLRLVEELQEELGVNRGKLEDFSESLELARSEIESRVRRVRELEEADEVRQREFDQFRRSRDRLEMDLQVARKESQRRSEQLGQAREEIRRQTEEYLTLRRQMGQRQNEVERLRRSVRGSDSRHTQEVQEVRRQAERTGLELETLRETVMSLREENAAQRDDLRRQRAEIAELTAQRDDLTEVLDDDAMNDDELVGAVDDIMSLVRA